jgi:ABC-type sugar transport system permease subunit
VGKEILDAARIDGAGWKGQIRHIYLPAIAPTIALLALVMTMGAMQIFEWVYMMAQHKGAITFMYNIYAEAFLYSRHGMAAAQSVILVAIILGFAFLQRRYQTWQSM